MGRGFFLLLLERFPLHLGEGTPFQSATPEREWEKLSGAEAGAREVRIFFRHQSLYVIKKRFE